MSTVHIKILLMGAAGVGKTELISKFVDKCFERDYKLTVGVDILTKDVEYNPDEIAVVSIWDVGGQKRFESIKSTFYRGTVGIILVFDLTRADTFDEAKKYLEDVKSFCEYEIPSLLIGNFFEKIEEFGEVLDRDAARQWIENQGGLYLETKSNLVSNIDDALLELTKRAVEKKYELYR